MNPLFFYLFIAIGIVAIAIILFFYNMNMVLGTADTDYYEDLYDNCIEMERLLGNEINQSDPEQDICHQKMIKLLNKS
jgi:hypothetical protein